MARGCGRVRCGRWSSARLSFWVCDFFLFCFVRECCAAAGEGFAQASAAGVAPVGIILSVLLKHAGPFGHLWTPECSLVALFCCFYGCGHRMQLQSESQLQPCHQWTPAKCDNLR